MELQPKWYSVTDPLQSAHTCKLQTSHYEIGLHKTTKTANYLFFLPKNPQYTCQYICGFSAVQNCVIRAFLLLLNPISQCAVYSITGTTEIGSNSGSIGFVDGLIDEVRIYNRALSSDEIKRLYNGGRQFCCMMDLLEI